MTLALAALAYGITVSALVLLAIRVRALIAVYKKGQPDPTRSGNRGARIKNMLTEVLGHTKMLNFTATGIAHWFVMIGFFALAGTLLTAYGQTINPSFTLPFLGHFLPYELFVDAIAILTGIGIVTLILIRQFTRILRPGKKSRFYGSGNWKAYFVELVILGIVLSVIALRGLEGSLNGITAFDWNYALTMPSVYAFNNLDQLTIEALIVLIASFKIFISMLWFIVVAANLTMGVAWHRFLAPFNIYFKRNADNAPTLGALPEMLSGGKPINFEDPSEDDIFGIGKAGTELYFTGIIAPAVARLPTVYVDW